MSRSVSQCLTQVLHAYGCKTVFGVPGAYSIDLNDKLEQNGIDYMLASHEGGAAFMSQAYAQVAATAMKQNNWGAIGCLISTAGPGALNAITGLVSAKADGDTVLIIHGAVPKAQLGRGALQDLCDLLGAPHFVMGRVTRQSVSVDYPEEFAKSLEVVQRELNLPAGQEGPVHFSVKMNVFPCATDAVVSQPMREEADDPLLEQYVKKAAALLRNAQRPVVLVGHGAYRGDRAVLQSFLERLKLSTMTTARGVAVIPASSPVLVGQHSIFSSPRALHLLEQKPDLLLALGTSLGEFASNSWSSLLSDISNLIHVNTNSVCFGRLKQGPVS